MPHPLAGPFPGTVPPAPPVNVWAQPMPLYAPCDTMPAMASAQYVVETKLMRACSASAAVNVESLSQCLVLEGARAEIDFCGNGSGAKPGQPASALGVCVVRAGKNKVGVEMVFERGHAEKCGKDGERMQCDCAHVCRTVKLGKPTHFVLRKSPAGAEETWAEVTVTEVPNAGPERLAKAPRPMPPACPVGGAVAGMAAAVGELCGCKVAAAGMTLPPGRYVNHPPQYFPPAPAFPPGCEMAGQAVVPMPPPPPPVGMVVPAPPLPAPVPVPVLAVPPAVGDDGPCLKCQSLALRVPADDEVYVRAGKGRVQVCGSDLEASADRVETTMGGRVLVLRGHVRLTRHLYGSEMHVEAERLKLTLQRESGPVKTAAPAAE
jgi:hypothetical protein